MVWCTSQKRIDANGLCRCGTSLNPAKMCPLYMCAAIGKQGLRAYRRRPDLKRATQESVWTMKCAGRHDHTNSTRKQNIKKYKRCAVIAKTRFLHTRHQTL